jgi:hypothetical protein
MQRQAGCLQIVLLLLLLLRSLCCCCSLPGASPTGVLCQPMHANFTPPGPPLTSAAAFAAAAAAAAAAATRPRVTPSAACLAQI